jgi:hypothetical protein
MATCTCGGEIGGYCAVGVAGHAGDDAHHVDGVGSAGENHVIRNLSLDGLTDRNHRRLGRGDRGSMVGATDHGCGQERTETQQSRTRSGKHGLVFHSWGRSPHAATEARTLETDQFAKSQTRDSCGTRRD